MVGSANFLVLFSVFIFLLIIDVTNGDLSYISQPVHQSPCNTLTDCDPDACPDVGMTCEVRYIRFWDPVSNVDRSRKSCQCVEEPICSVMGMHAFSGCKTYADLGMSGQRMIREWSMSRAERRSFYKLHIFQKYINGTNSTKAKKFLPTPSRRSFQVYSDRTRHHQLILANTRFCCKTSRKIRRFAAQAYVSYASNCFENKLLTLVLISTLHSILYVLVKFTG